MPSLCKSCPCSSPSFTITCASACLFVCAAVVFRLIVLTWWKSTVLTEMCGGPTRWISANVPWDSNKRFSVCFSDAFDFQYGVVILRLREGLDLSHIQGQGRVQLRSSIVRFCARCEGILFQLLCKTPCSFPAHLFLLILIENMVSTHFFFFFFGLLL